MERTEAIEWLKSIKEKYIHGGDDFYDHQRRTAIDYAVMMLEQKLQTNADCIRAMSDEELAWELMTWRLETEAKHKGIESNYPNTQKSILEWLKLPAEDSL